MNGSGFDSLIDQLPSPKIEGKDPKKKKACNVDQFMMGWVYIVNLF